VVDDLVEHGHDPVRVRVGDAAGEVGQDHEVPNGLRRRALAIATDAGKRWAAQLVASRRRRAAGAQRNRGSR
jgi:hypothetical protein